MTQSTIRLTVNGQVAVDRKVADAERAWATAIEQKMNRREGTGNP